MLGAEHVSAQHCESRDLIGEQVPSPASTSAGWWWLCVIVLRPSRSCQSSAGKSPCLIVMSAWTGNGQPSLGLAEHWCPLSSLWGSTGARALSRALCCIVRRISKVCFLWNCLMNTNNLHNFMKTHWLGKLLYAYYMKNVCLFRVLNGIDSLKTDFIEVWYMCNKLHLFKVCDSVNFSSEAHVWSHDQSQNRKHFHEPQKDCVVSSGCIPTSDPSPSHGCSAFCCWGLIHIF